MSFNSIMFHLLSGLWHLGCTNPISGISHYRVTHDVPVYTSPLKHSLLKNTEKIRSHLTHMVRKLFVLHIDRIWASLVAQMIEKHSLLKNTKKIRSHLTHMVRKLFVLYIDRIWASLVAQMIENLSAMWYTQVWSLGREDPPGEGNDYLLQYSCLENSMDRGAWWAIVHGVIKRLVM